MRNCINSILESLHTDPINQQQETSNWSADDMLFTKERFQTILSNLVEAKQKNVDQIEEEKTREAAQGRFEAILGKQLRKILLENI